MHSIITEPQPQNYKKFTEYRVARTIWRAIDIKKRPHLNNDVTWKAFHRVTLKRWLRCMPIIQNYKDLKMHKTIPTIQVFVDEYREELHGKTTKEIAKLYGQWLANLCPATI